MANYLKSELYRLVHKKALYAFFAACVLIPLLVTLLTAASGGEQYANTAFVFMAASKMWSLLFYVLPLMVSMLVADEFADGTLKNTVAYGISRSTVFYGKWIMELLFMAVAWVFTYTSLTASVFLLLPNNGLSSFHTFTSSIAGVLPLALAALTVSHCFCFLSEKPMPHLVGYAVVIVLVPEFYYMFASPGSSLGQLVEKLPLFPYAAANDLAWLQNNGMLLCWTVGAAYVLLAFLMSARRVEKVEWK
jgi:ABC-type transport system involved in multi-copper enzyme maturation permease subunit